MSRRTDEIIREDLKEFASRRLQHWLEDSLDRYRTARLSYGFALCDIMMIQAAAIVAMTSLAKLSKEDLLDLVGHIYDQFDKAGGFTKHNEESH